MSNKITLFVSISLFVILSAFVVLSKDQGKYKITLVLNDGQTVLLDSILTKFPDNSISENFSSINLSSAILRSFDSDTNNINDFKIYVNDLLINKYVDYWQVTPNSNSRLSDFRYIFEENNSDFNWEKISGFGYYYHNLFRSKSARTVLFKKALDFIEVMCRIYPIDFKKRVLIELESLLKFTNTIKFISLNNDIEYEDYWEGFIVRRHFIDNVPVLEIQNSILEAINRIKNMTPTNTFNALYEITKINYNKVKGELDDVKNNFKIISKYRKMAELATFSNSFIELCLALPKTLEEYVEQGKKTLYDYGITTGCGVDGKVISINRIEKQYRNVAQKIREAIADKKDVGTICSRYNFAGYEMSIEIHNDNGVFRGFLSLEYKNCGNGYYYLLINDDNFIGYDVD